MDIKYIMNGSNTVYQVFGIMTIVFGIITGLINLFYVICYCIGVSWLEGIGSGEEFTTTAVLLIILYLLIATLVVYIKIDTGALLTKTVFKSKGYCIYCAVLYFMSASGWLFLSLVYLIIGVGGSAMMSGLVASTVFLAIICFVKIVWDVVIGVLLISKQKNAIPMLCERGARYVQRPYISNVSSGNNVQKIPYNVPNTFVIGTIEGLFGDYQGRIFELHEGEICKVGRGADCNIQIEHSKVSRLHCVIRKMSNGKYQITDHSSNGTFYENSRLAKGIETEVEPGGMLVIGEADNVLMLN